MKQNSFILAAGVSLAMAFTFSCSSDGSDGKDGAQGLQGETGANGAGCIVSSVDEGTKITCGTSTVIIPNAANGTNGTDGIDGANGIDGTNGTNGADGIDGINGIDGESCEAEQGSDGVITITCGESTVGIAFCGDENKFYNPINQLCNYNGEPIDIDGHFTDIRDGKKYAYVEIGDYLWMAENLIYDTENGNYTWEEALEACPAGWELPEISAIVGLKVPPSTLNLSSGSYWWSATEYDEDNTYASVMGIYLSAISNFTRDKTSYQFVRCVKAN